MKGIENHEKETIMTGSAPRPEHDIDMEHALKNPAALFSMPRDVLNAPGLSEAEQRAILEQWELDARQLEGSAAEGMGGGEPPLLAEVRAALRALPGSAADG